MSIAETALSKDGDAAVDCIPILMKSKTRKYLIKQSKLDCQRYHKPIEKE